MTKRAVEITLISATDVKNFRLFGKMSPSAVVSIAHTNLQQVARVAVEGHTHPIWDQKFSFLLDEHLLTASASAFVRLYPSARAGGDSLGVAQIPLFTRDGAYDSEMFGQYPVFRPSGRRQGYVNVSVKVAAPVGYGKANVAAEYPMPAMGVPAGATAGPSPGASSYAGQQTPYAAHQGGYYQPPPPGYAGAYYRQYAYPQGYGGQQPQVVVVERNHGYGGGGFGGAGLGLGAGFLGGLLIGEIL